MEHRVLGKTGIPVSTVGFGSWAIGGDAWGPVDDDTSLAAIDRALELGVSFFDTADVYGRGHSEELLGRALAGRRDDVVLATKVGLWDSHVDVEPNIYSDPKLIQQRCEESLRRLATDRIDVYLCHLWWDENAETFLEAFAELQRQGKIRAYGVSTDNVEHLRHFDQDGTCSVVQLEYSILNRNAEHELLPYCLANDLGVIVRGPLQKGLLTGKFDDATTFPAGDVRHGWPQEEWWMDTLAKVERLRALRPSLVDVALDFVLAHPAVHTAIPGAKTPAQVEANARVGATKLTDEERTLIDEVTGARAVAERLPG